jgi:hypothetical protein
MVERNEPEEVTERRVRAGSGKGRMQVVALPVARTSKRTFVSKAHKDAFLLRLIETCNVRMAARKAGLGISTLYRLKLRDAEFRRSWMQVLSAGYDMLEMEMLRRALLGAERVEEIFERNGRKVKRVRSFDSAGGLRQLKYHRDSVARHRAKEDEVREPARVRIARMRATIHALLPPQLRIAGPIEEGPRDDGSGREGSGHNGE